MKKTILFFVILTSMPFYAQWVPQVSGVTQNLNDVYCITGNTVVVVGNGGTILKTTDGGANWLQKTSGATSNLMKVQFLSPTIGYAVGTNGTLLKTINAGESWTSIAIGGNTNLFGLSVLNENTFFISGDGGLVEKTTDGGTSFSVETSPENQTVSDIQFFNENVGFAKAGVVDFFHQFNNFYKTTDGGTTWTLVTSDPIDSFFFLNENIGFINKTNNGFYKTTDGGLNFMLIGNSKSLELDIYTVNENVVWDIGNFYTLCSCDNYCISKRFADVQQQIDNCYNTYTFEFLFTAIHFANETTGYVVGINGTIYKNGTGINVPLAVDEFKKTDMIKIYPNPASSTITIENNSSSIITSITISDINGRKVLEAKNDKSNIDISSLVKGVYLVKVSSDNGNVTKKLIRE